jgi:hypothetical protein
MKDGGQRPEDIGQVQPARRDTLLGCELRDRFAVPENPEHTVDSETHSIAAVFRKDG